MQPTSWTHRRRRQFQLGIAGSENAVFLWYRATSILRSIKNARGLMSPQIDRQRPVPGTQVFGLQESHRGMRINRLCSTLTQPENRDAYRADEHAYLNRFGLTPEEKSLIAKRDFSGLLAAGGNIFFLIKLASVTGVPIYRMGAQMRGESYESFLSTRNQAGAI